MTYNNYCGNENVAYIYYNEWADPKIEYKGFQWSAWAVEEALRATFEEEEGASYCESAFVAYVNHNVESYLDDCIYGMTDFDIHYIRDNAPDWFEYLRDSLYYSDEWTYTRLPHDWDVVNHYDGISFVPDDFIAA